MSYKVYVDDELLYHQNIKNLSIQSATVELEQNKIGTFKFDVYPSNPRINDLKEMESIIKVFRDDYLLFKGIVGNSTIGYRNKRTIQCKQDYHFLTFSIQRPYDFNGDIADFLQMILDSHNEQVEDKHKIMLGDVTVTDPNGYIVRSDGTYLNTWDTIQKKLIELLGGYIRFRYIDDVTYLDYLEDFEDMNSQTIDFKQNMIDVIKEYSGLDICTVLIPRGARIEGEQTENGAEIRVDITSVNNGRDYIEDLEAIKKYGRIAKTETWDDVTEPSNLLSKAKKSLNDKLYKILGIEVKALDMGLVERDINNFNMYAYIQVKSAFHGIDDFFLPMKMSINLFTPQNNKISLNTTKKSLTDVQISTDNNYTTIIKEINDVKNKTDSFDMGVIDNKIGAMNDSIQEVVSSYTSEIEKAKDSISIEVAERYYTKDEAQQLIEENLTAFEQTHNSFEFKFSEFSKEIDSVQNNSNQKFESIEKMIRLVDGKIVIGIEGNEYTLEQENDSIAIKQNGYAVAYLTKERLYAPDGEFINSFTMGNFKQVVTSSGKVCIKKAR